MLDHLGWVEVAKYLCTNRFSDDSAEMLLANSTHSS